MPVHIHLICDLKPEKITHYKSTEDAEYEDFFNGILHFGAQTEIASKINQGRTQRDSQVHLMIYSKKSLGGPWELLACVVFLCLESRCPLGQVGKQPSCRIASNDNAYR